MYFSSLGRTSTNTTSTRGSRRAQLDEQVGVVRPGARGRQARLGSEGVDAGLVGVRARVRVRIRVRVGVGVRVRVRARAGVRVRVGVSVRGWSWG